MYLQNMLRWSSAPALRGHSAPMLHRPAFSSRRRTMRAVAEKKEYYDYKDMPPLPLTVSRITIPEIGYTLVDKDCEDTRQASMAIFFDIYQDEQYGARLSRKSALTALCMFDRDDVDASLHAPGDFPNIDLLHRIYNEGLDYQFVVEEIRCGGRGRQ